jgi:hypothetical protein
MMDVVIRSVLPKGALDGMTLDRGCGQNRESACREAPIGTRSHRFSIATTAWKTGRLFGSKTPTGGQLRAGQPGPGGAYSQFRGYANAIRDELPDAVPVLDAFHVVKLGTHVVDEVRRRVQQDTLARRGHKHDPLYRIRGLLRRGQEHLSERQLRRLNAGLVAGDPHWEVTVAWHCYQQVRSMYQAPTPAQGRRIAEQVIADLPTCPIPEVARLGRSLRQWRPHVLARFDTHRISNGGTEAVNLLIEKTRRLAHGFRTFEHYRLRILLAASGSRP